MIQFLLVALAACCFMCACVLTFFWVIDLMIHGMIA